LRAPGFIEIRAKSPLRDSTRAHFNETVDAETDEGDAASEQPRD
jgi:hypothetical protein